MTNSIKDLHVHYLRGMPSVFTLSVMKRECESFGFQAYRVLSAAGLADKDPARDAYWTNYQRLKALASTMISRTARFRKFELPTGTSDPTLES